jgi:phosphonopyruvate decarboxylase
MSEEMIAPDLGELARSAGVTAVYGVPDSLMKNSVASLEEAYSPNGFTIAANEGAAVGLAIGHHIATGGLPIVFMQNSGFGNSLNPLISLADSEVYSIPLLLLVGWRAEILDSGDQKKDEPQHVSQGRVTIGQLQLIGIDHYIIGPESDIEEALNAAARSALDGSCPVALVFRSGVSSRARKKPRESPAVYPSREQMISVVAKVTAPSGPLGDAPVIATTGMASRELHEARRSLKSVRAGQDFLTVGGMGHAISIAASVAQELHPRPVICLDGDGATLMHMGALLQAAQRHNLIHIILDNGVHDSVGGQPTGFRGINVEALAGSFQYRNYIKVETAKELLEALAAAHSFSGSALIHAMCEPGHRDDLGRPAAPPQEAKQAFMEFISEIKHPGQPRSGRV